MYFVSCFLRRWKSTVCVKPRFSCLGCLANVLRSDLYYSYRLGADQWSSRRVRDGEELWEKGVKGEGKAEILRIIIMVRAALLLAAGTRALKCCKRSEQSL